MRTLFSPNQRSSFFRNGSEMTEPQTPESRNQPPESEDGTVEKGDGGCLPSPEATQSRQPVPEAPNERVGPLSTPQWHGGESCSDMMRRLSCNRPYML